MCNNTKLAKYSAWYEAFVRMKYFVLTAVRNRTGYFYSFWVLCNILLRHGRRFISTRQCLQRQHYTANFFFKNTILLFRTFLDCSRNDWTRNVFTIYFFFMSENSTAKSLYGHTRNSKIAFNLDSLKRSFFGILKSA